MAAFDELRITLPDGYLAYARFWPVENPRAAVLYHHGIQSHAGWYEESARRLQGAGFATLQVDRRGCGRNDRDRGHAESAEQLLADAHAARDELLRRTGLTAYHVVGVSWGGKLAVAACVDRPKGVASLTLVTPGLFPREGASREKKAEIGFAMIYEREKPYPIPLDDPAFFTADPHWQEFIASDVLTLRECTAGFYLASRRMDRMAARLPQAPPLPIHLLLAGEEPIIDNDKTSAYVEKLGWAESRITRYAGARHSLEFEAVRENYFRDLVGFLSASRAMRAPGAGQ